MKKSILITGLSLFIFLASCRGPLAKPETPGQQSVPKPEVPQAMGASTMGSPKVTKEEVKIEPVKGSITIAALVSDKKNYSGKIVKIHGKVTKVNPGIMGKNWIHIQDGTEAGGLFDLTITSDFVPQIGSIITVEGRIALDKDFGYGYTYPVLMEEGRLVQ